MLSIRRVQLTIAQLLSIPASHSDVQSGGVYLKEGLHTYVSLISVLLQRSYTVLSVNNFFIVIVFIAYCLVLLHLHP